MKMYCRQSRLQHHRICAARLPFAVQGEGGVLRSVNDRDTGEPRGFGFVEMNNDDEANKAMAALNGATLDGRRSRSTRPSRRRRAAVVAAAVTTGAKPAR